MTRRHAVLAALVLAVGAGFAAARASLRPSRWRPPAASASAVPEAAEEPRRKGGLDLGFLVFSDTHFGFDTREKDRQGRPRDAVRDPDAIDRINQTAIADMNAIAGKPWPDALGGTIGEPRGLVLTGDLTEDGDAWQWRQFVAHYGLNGHDALLHYPVFETWGNHDKHWNWDAIDRVRERHHEKLYAFDWGDLHLVSLGEAPDDDDLAWLGRDLGAVGHARPIALYFHFPLRGPFSENNWFGRGEYRDHLARTLAGYNVIAIFHGHYHATGRYRWHGIDVFKAGAAKHRQHAFLVVHVDDASLRVAAWQFGERHWEWWYQKPINGTPGAVLSGGAHEARGLLVEGE